MRGYERAALTLNFVRSLVDGGFADLHHPEYWDLDFVGHSPQEREYREIVGSIRNSLDFFESISGGRFTRPTASTFIPATKACICCMSRPRPAFCRGVSAGTACPRIFRGSGCAPRRSTARTSNSTAGFATRWGSRSGPGMTAEWLQELIGVLNPNNEPGRLVLIHRFGGADRRAGCRR